MEEHSPNRQLQEEGGPVCLGEEARQERGHLRAAADPAEEGLGVRLQLVVQR